jgi:uncharacterized protein (TIGR02996 family)
MSDEAAFLRAVAENPSDATAKLVYADWLDERGEPDRAAYLRLLASDAPDPERTRELESRIGGSWRGWLNSPLPRWDAATFYALGKLEALLHFYEGSSVWQGPQGYNFTASLEPRSADIISDRFNGSAGTRFQPVTAEPIGDWVGELTRVFHKWFLSREVGTPAGSEWAARVDTARLEYAIDCVRDVLRPLRGWRGLITPNGWYAADWDHLALEAADRVLFLDFLADD